MQDMTAFGASLESYLIKKNMRAGDFAEKAGIHESTLSRYMSPSKNAFLPDAVQFGRIMELISGEEERRAILLAYVRDRLPSKLRPMVDVVMNPGRTDETPGRKGYGGVALSKKDHDIIEYWAGECAKDPAVGKHLRWMAKDRPAE